MYPLFTLRGKACSEKVEWVRECGGKPAGRGSREEVLCALGDAPARPSDEQVDLAVRQELRGAVGEVECLRGDVALP